MTLGLLIGWAGFSHAEWKPVDTAALTQWGKQVTEENAWSAYPRPRMSRPRAGEQVWQSLNGIWDYAVTASGGQQPPVWTGEILVPFTPGSSLSGVEAAPTDRQRVWSRRTFRVAKDWGGKRILLNLRAGDAMVWLNGSELGSEQDGMFDLSEALKGDGEQEIVIATDHLGLAGAVWLEPVAAAYLMNVCPVPDVDRGTVTVEIDAVLDGTVNLNVQVSDPKGRSRGAASLGLTYEGAAAGVDHEVRTGVTIPLPNARLWAPGSPQLHRYRVEMKREGEVIDSVEGFFGMRKVARSIDGGVRRMLLNNEPQIQLGVSYRGRWPDAGRSAPSEAAMQHDVQLVADLGFNMIQVEGAPLGDGFYHHCDRLGILVWQALPAGARDDARRIVDRLRGHSCIVMWSGDQHVDWLRAYDPSRLTMGRAGDILRADSTVTVVGPLADDAKGLQRADRSALNVDRKRVRAASDKRLGLVTPSQ